MSEGGLPVLRWHRLCGGTWETLRDRLQELSMSQVELARRTGITTKHISQVVQGWRVSAPRWRRNEHAPECPFACGYG